MAISSSVVVIKLLVICLAVTSPEAAEALTCGQVSNSLSPCVEYLKASGAVPPPCCDGIRWLGAAAKTPTDRKTTCQCLKSAAAGIKGINPDLAAGLPGQCGVSVPYKISPSTDCDSVQ